MKQQREISLAGMTFPFQSAGPAEPLFLHVVWAPSLGASGADATTQQHTAVCDITGWYLIPDIPRRSEEEGRNSHATSPKRTWREKT